MYSGVRSTTGSSLRTTITYGMEWGSHHQPPLLLRPYYHRGGHCGKLYGEMNISLIIKREPFFI